VKRNPESVSTEAATPVADEGPLCLLVLTPAGVSSVPLVEGARITIGRGEGCDVRIEDAKASRRHLVLQISAPVMATDLGSMNGTLLGERRMPADVPVPLAPGDTLAIGATRLILQRAPRVPSIPRPSPSTDLAYLLDRVANSTINALIVGETGVGKEVTARALHAQSARAKGPLVCVNCAALSETLLESELFGYERGAFTGALHSKPGLLETAHEGTVFLDEIGEMPLALQAKLLRVLELREVQRLGALKPRRIDVRFVFATNRNLEEEVAAGRFRSDLFFRVNGIMIPLPPLRERLHEIEPLARGFADNAAHGRRPPAFSQEVLAAFRAHRWPGNVRELKNVVERALVLCAGDVITTDHLPPEIGRLANEGPQRVVHPETIGPAADLVAEPDERRRIEMALARCNGNQTQAAVLLGISRRTLVSRLGTLDLPRPRKKP
jgi:two-component system, NtrC family, response regulator AtoC